MGNQEVTPATEAEVDEYFKGDYFTISGCCDVDKLKENISDKALYVGAQKQLEEVWSKKKYKLSDTVDKTKKIYRRGIPDSYRRRAFLEHYELDPIKCRVTYKAVCEDTNKEELEIAQEDRPSKPFLHAYYLNEKGVNDLEIVVHLLNKEKHIEYSPMLINSIALLLVYLPVEETY